MDFLFHGWVPEWALRRNVYPIHANVGYTHGLADEDLAQVLERNVRQGLFQLERHSAGDHYTLTAAGGSLWEAERAPNWSRYLRDEWLFKGPPGSGPQLRLRSPDPGTIDRFLEANGEVGLLLPARGQRRRTYVLRDAPLVPWRTFHEVHLVLVRVGMDPWPPAWEAVDWRKLAALRTWWRGAPEIVESGARRDDQAG